MDSSDSDDDLELDESPHMPIAARARPDFEHRLEIVRNHPRRPALLERVMQQLAKQGTRVNSYEEPPMTITEQNSGQWLIQIERDEAQRMETPTEKRRRERTQELRDLRRHLKLGDRFVQIARRVRRLQQGPARDDALRQGSGWRTYVSANIG
jgi:hypothetical protein